MELLKEFKLPEPALSDHILLIAPDSIERQYLFSFETKSKNNIRNNHLFAKPSVSSLLSLSSLNVYWCPMKQQ